MTLAAAWGNLALQAPANASRRGRGVILVLGVPDLRQRHTTASLLKKLRVPPRDAQMILAQAHIPTTM